MSLSESTVLDEMVDSLQDVVAHMRVEADALIEAIRAKRVRDLKLADRKLASTFDALTLVAATTCATPVAHITIIDDAHQYIKNRYGPPLMGPDMCERSSAVCNLTIQHPTELTIIPDASLDPRTMMNPWVMMGEIVFYAGAPLTTEDGLALGSLCVVDDKPRPGLDETQIALLLAMARVTTALLCQTPPLTDATTKDG